MTGREKALLAALGVGAGVLATSLAGSRRGRGFAGKVVLITGGSKGLGLQLAREFGRRGAKVAICARDGGELDRASEALDRLRIENVAVRCDLTKQAEIESLIAQVRRRFGRVDVLVNNAGTILVGPVEATRLEDFQEAMDVIFWGSLRPILALLPEWLERGSGSIVNISSVGGKVAVPHLVAYSAAKFAVAGLSEGLRAELGPKGIHVTAIYPGLLRTGSFVNAEFRGRTTQEADWFTAGATAPGLSMNVESAARSIVDAVSRGDAEKVIGAPAQALAGMQRLWPSGMLQVLSAVASVLPGPGRGAKGSGVDVIRLLNPVVKLLALSARGAARRLNQRAA